MKAANPARTQPRGPAVDPAEGERRHEAGQPDEVQGAAGEIETRPRRATALVDEQRRGGGRADQPDRDVEPEDGLPAEPRQPAAEDRSEDQPGADDHRVDAQRAAELPAREGVGHERGRVGHQEGATDTLDEPGDDEQEGRRRERAGDRGGGEQREPGGVGPGTADLVGDPAGVEQEHGRGQRVADDDPQQREQVGVEVAQDLGQRDDERPRGQCREQRADARDAEDDPAVAVAGLTRDQVDVAVAGHAPPPDRGASTTGSAASAASSSATCERTCTRRACASSIIDARRAALASSRVIWRSMRSCASSR